MIMLDHNSIYENQLVDTLVGNFSTDDMDEPYTYTLVSGSGDTGNSGFTINENQLLSNDIFVTNIQLLYFIRVRSTDSVGLFIEQEFTVTIFSTAIPVINEIISSTGKYSTSPVISMSGRVGNRGLKISGENLNGSNLKLYFNDIDVTSCITSSTNREIRFMIPYLTSGLYAITVTHSGGATNGI